MLARNTFRTTGPPWLSWCFISPYHQAKRQRFRMRQVDNPVYIIPYLEWLVVGWLACNLLVVIVGFWPSLGDSATLATLQHSRARGLEVSGEQLRTQWRKLHAKVDGVMPGGAVVARDRGHQDRVPGPQALLGRVIAPPHPCQPTPPGRSALASLATATVPAAASRALWPLEQPETAPAPTLSGPRPDRRRVLWTGGGFSPGC